MQNNKEVLRLALRKAVFAIPDEQLISRDIIINAVESAIAAVPVSGAVDEREADCYGIRYIDPTDGQVAWDHCWTNRDLANERINDMVQRYVDNDMTPPVFELVPLVDARTVRAALQPAQTAHEEK